ncbi:MAG: FliG C-terminal domain-containing protein [Planctomycetota bacterium]|jgi:flagellar motor switch protein FliG
MALTGRQKAAMLLMSLDTATAAQMVKGLDPETVQELAVELVCQDAAGLQTGEARAEIVRQFCDSLENDQTFHIGGFLNEMLNSTLGEDRAAQIRAEIGEMLQKRDPFVSIRSVDAQAMASVLETEHPQTAAVVLSELPPERSSEVIGLLGERVRIDAISRMTSGESVTAEAKARIVEMICGRLGDVMTGCADQLPEARPEESPRRVAMILRNLVKELRDGLLRAIEKEDREAGEMVSKLMVVWADIPQVADRPLQEALTQVGARELALALHRADEVIAEKIRSNISEQAVAAVDEEASLMLAPSKEDVEAARDAIVWVLREMNEKGELVFAKEQYDG